MIETKYIGLIDGMHTWEVYQDEKLIGINQSAPDEETHEDHI
jgi:hypothetical protein